MRVTSKRTSWSGAALAAGAAVLVAASGCGSGSASGQAATTAGGTATAPAPPAATVTSVPGSTTGGVGGTTTAPTATSGSDLSAVTTRVADDLRSRFAAVAASSSVADLQRRLGDLDTALRHDAAAIRSARAPASARARQQKLAAQLDGLEARLSQARSRAQKGDLAGALSVLQASGYRAVQDAVAAAG